MYGLCSLKNKGRDLSKTAESKIKLGNKVVKKKIILNY